MAATHADLMDQIYSWQAGIYDVTRRFFLFGRNQLLNEMPVTANDRVLEVGCGTGRNLRMLARRNPGLHLWGLDVSTVMLETSRKKIDAEGFGDRIHLTLAYGEEFHYNRSFGLDQPFTKIFFSYSLTMIPTWRETVQNALDNLVPGGEIWMVDFYDQRDMPALFRNGLVAWLNLFHVAYKPELLPFLEDVARSTGGELVYRGHGGGYYYIARFRKAL